jgi:hypothetical protein
MKKGALLITGFLILSGAVPAAVFLWDFLPPGRYPVVLVGIPALPVLWAGFTCLKLGGMEVDGLISQHPWRTASLLCLLTVLAVLIASALGVLRH